MFRCPAAISSQWLLGGQHVSRISISQEWGSGTLGEQQGDRTQASTYTAISGFY